LKRVRRRNTGPLRGARHATTIERLEDRRLFSAGAALGADGSLIVTGTDPGEGADGNDVIELTASTESVTVTINGEVFSFPGASVRQVTVNALGGDDAVTVRKADPTFMSPFVGTVTVGGGSGANTLRIEDPLPWNADYVLTDASLTASASGSPARQIAFTDFGSVSLRTGSGTNTIRLAPSASTGFAVDAGDPSGTGAADALWLDLQGAASPRREASQIVGTGRYTFADRRTIAYANVELADDLRPPEVTGGGLYLPTPLSGFDTTVAVNFTEPVVLPTNRADALRLVNLSTGQALDPAVIRSGGSIPSENQARFLLRVGFNGTPPPGGRYRATIPAGSVTDFSGNPTQSDFSFEFDVGPRVLGAWIDGSTWPQAFRTFLDDIHVGSPADGYELAPATIIGNIPPAGWSNINRLRVRFNGPVDVDANDLALTLAGGETASVTDFSYDPETFTALWTLSAPLPAGVHTLRLNSDAAAGGVGAPGGGPALDGELLRGVYNQSNFRTGDGRPGGDFVQSFAVLPGDTTRNRTVNALDVADVKNRLGTVVSQYIDFGRVDNYFPYSDVNADGRINALDLAAVKRNLTRSVPPPPYTTPASLPAASPTQDLSSEQPFL
jgi:hypothetical protein